MPGPSYADNLVLCGETEEDLRGMVGQFVEVCRRRGLKVNAGKNKVMDNGVRWGGGIGKSGLVEWDMVGACVGF